MVSHICVVMAVYNRLNSVHNALHSWSLQTNKDFSIVVADDGSSDDIHQLIRLYEDKLSLHYYRHRHKNVAVVLNKGMAVAPKETTHVWHTDGDIIFNPKAVEAAYKHIEEYPERVIAGRYDWLPAMKITPYVVENDFQRIVRCELPRIEGIGGPPELKKDHRLQRHNEDFFDHKLMDSCKPVLGSNIIAPLKAMYAIGGLDEDIPGSNANDADTGWSLTDAGYHLLTCDEIIGYHQFHERHPERLQEGVRKALPYIFTKHNAPIPERWMPENAEQEIAEIKRILATRKPGLGWRPDEDNL
jgi:chondroitin synthase